MTRRRRDVPHLSSLEITFEDVQRAFKDARGSSGVAVSEGVTVFLLDCCRNGLSTSVGSDRSVDGSFTSRPAVQGGLM